MASTSARYSYLMRDLSYRRALWYMIGIIALSGQACQRRKKATTQGEVRYYAR